MKAPIPVTVALRIDQVTDVDQVAENYSVVANMQLEWRDPNWRSARMNASAGRSSCVRIG
ncbi:MAG: hypothetical protein R2851_11355 [Caldilineaceae bacterium]